MPIDRQRPVGEHPDNPNVLSVWELTSQIKGLLETSFPSVWVSGEISNLSRPQSGHFYFTLKDERAGLRAVIWRGTATRLRFDLQDGLEVVCHGALDLYAPRGSYQLVIQQVHPKGMGALELALRKLQQRLAAEGLFDPAHKRPLVRFPRRIALITSPTGAAIRDFLQIAGRRWPGTEVLVVPVRVQGEGAAAEIAAALGQVNRLRVPIDTVVVGRGGGSLEDLWAFNEEPVVRAIHASRIPVVSAVGHEIDVTLSDLAADVRALTPSEAAELVVPSADEVSALLGRQSRRLSGALQARAVMARSRLDALATRAIFRRPMALLYDRSRRLDELASRASRAMAHRRQSSRAAADALAARLESLSPLAVLGRGYSLTQRLPDGQLIRDASQLAAGDQIRTRLARGEIISRVE